VNWNVSLMGLKFLGSDGSGTTADAVSAILYAAANGADVLNNSWAGGDFSQSLLEAIQFADARDSLFVAAAGNDGMDNDAAPTYPASYDVPNVLAVAASDSNDRHAFFSNFGKRSVDVSAPGVNIYSTWPGGSYQYASGTSMAAPHAAGIAALVEAAQPGASDVGVKTGSADIEIEGQVNEVRVKTGSGDVTCDSFTGAAQIETGSGDVEVSEAMAELRVKSGSGDMSIGNCLGNLNVSTGSGDVEIGIPAGTPVWADINTVTGSVRSNLESVGAPQEGQEHVELQARTVSGDILLREV